MGSTGGTGLTVVYTNADGLAVNSKELLFTDSTADSYSDIIGIIKKKFN